MCRMDSRPKMPEITFIEADGTEHHVDVPVGVSVMQGAVNHAVPGIEGDCGGMCACGTCHVYVPSEWITACGIPDQLEEDILAFAFEVNEQSRLSCQIEMSDALSGLVVHMPLRQY